MRNAHTRDKNASDHTQCYSKVVGQLKAVCMRLGVVQVHTALLPDYWQRDRELTSEFQTRNRIQILRADFGNSEPELYTTNGTGNYCQIFSIRTEN